MSEAREDALRMYKSWVGPVNEVERCDTSGPIAKCFVGGEKFRGNVKRLQEKSKKGLRISYSTDSITINNRLQICQSST